MQRRSLPAQLGEKLHEPPCREVLGDVELRFVSDAQAGQGPAAHGFSVG